MKKKHKWKYQPKIKKKIIVLVVLGVLLFVGMGYAIINSDLGIGGTLEVSKYDKTLQAALKREVNKGYALKYTGNHQDSMDPTKSTEDIYYFYAETSAKGNDILNKNNVVFANHCWQMIRTTDTGGVKLLYNGEPEEIIVDGVTKLNCGDTRNAYHIGEISSTYDLSGSKKYAKNYTVSTSGTTTTFTLVDDQEDPDDTYTVNMNASNADTEIAYIKDNYPYTCGNTTGTCTNASFYKVSGQSDGTVATVYKSTDNDNIGTSAYNANANLPTYVGYKYGDVYNTGSFGTNNNLTLIQELYSRVETVYWNAYNPNVDYGDTIEYLPAGSSACMDSNACYEIPLGLTYSFSNPQVDLVGKYVITNAGFSSRGRVTYGSGSHAYFVVGKLNANVFYVIELTNGNVVPKGLNVADSVTSEGELVDPTYISLTSIIDANGYTITQPIDISNKYVCEDGGTTCSNPQYVLSSNIWSNNGYYVYVDSTEQITIAKDVSGLNLVDYKTISLIDWINTYYNNQEYRYTCGNTDTTCTDSNFKFMYFKRKDGFYYSKNYYYGSSVIYEDNKYKLQGAIQLNPNDLNSLSTHHYTCLGIGETECTSVAYAYYMADTGSAIKYVLLNDPNVSSVETALDNMLKNNTTDSNVKTKVDEWYENKLLNTTYEAKLDDTIYCNDRSLRSSFTESGWNASGGSLSNYLYFKESSGTDDLSCTNIEDKFSVSNNDAKLTYKIGLFSQPELKLVGQKSARKTKSNYWLLSANRFDGSSYVRRLATDGNLGSGNTVTVSAIRPAISLIAGTKYSSGNGSMTDPYIVDMSE